jgi:predicted nuclease of predicted toxin-antitoxin system
VSNTIVIEGKTGGQIQARISAVGCIKNLLFKAFGVCPFFRSEYAKELCAMDAKNNFGETALHIASSKGNLESTLLLMAEGASCNEPDQDGKTPLHIAALGRHTMVLNSLLEARADVNAMDKRGDLPINMIESTSGQEHSESARGCACIRALQWRGAAKYTPLMICAETGVNQLRQYLNIRNLISEEIKLRQAGMHSKWYEDKVRKYSKYMNEDWNWTDIEKSSMTLDRSKLILTKTADFPDFSCALGKPFKNGIHVWEIVVQNVRSMWVGIAAGVTQSLDSGPSSSNNCYLVVFHNDGKCPQFKPEIMKNTVVKILSDATFFSGQRIRFRLNIKKKKLSMRVDGTKVASVSELEVEDIRAFVCMDYQHEIAVLERRIFKTYQEGSIMMSPDQSFLSDSGIDTDPVFNMQLLHISGKGDSKRVLEMISANTDITSSMNEETSALHCIVANAQCGKGSIDCIKLLLKQKLDINCVDSAGKTALHLAVELQKFNLVMSLCDLRANIHIRDKEGHSALDLAPKTFNSCLSFLKRRGANGWTPLIHAAEVGSSAVYKHLQVRELLCCWYQGKESFPSWFQDKIREFPVMRKTQPEFKWEKLISKSMEISENLLLVKKINDFTDYSSALSSECPDEGISVWEIEVLDVQSMWLGIAQIEEKDLAFSPLDEKGLIIAISCDGECFGIGDDKIEYFSSSSYTSNDLVKFELNYVIHRLHVLINDVLAISIRIPENESCVQEFKFRPYVCMDYLETARIVSSAIYVPVPEHESVLAERREAVPLLTGRRFMENQFWSDLQGGLDSSVDKVLYDIASELKSSLSQNSHFFNFLDLSFE